MRCLLFNFVTLLLLLLTPVVFPACTAHQESIPAPATDCERVATWVKTTHPKSGTYPGLDLPSSFRSLATDGKVDAVVLSDGRIILLFKTSIGWKGNWSGFIYASSPLKSSEMGKDYYGRPKLMIVGLQDHFVEQKVDDQNFKVSFDLN